MMKILYAEDETLLRDEIAFILELNGHEVRVAGDGQEAWEMIQEAAPEILITDLKMPRLTGNQLLEKVRSSDHKQLPVIVTSAYTTGEWKEESLSHGILAYLDKPFSIKRLIELVS